MTDIDKPEQHSLRGPAAKRIAVALIPVLFLLVAFLSLRKRSAPAGHESRPVLSETESRRLSDQSKSFGDQGQYANALAPTLTLYKAYPENQIYIERLAIINDHLGRYDEEARYWEKYMDNAPTPIGACPQYGQAYWKQGEGLEAKAIAAYRRCLALDPTNSDSIFYLAHALEMSRQWTEAAEQYRKGLAISPTYDDLTLGLARCLLRMDKPAEAKKLVVPLLNREHVSSDAMLAIGMYYLHEENYPMAKRTLSEGARLSRTDPDFPALLARVAEQSGDKAEEMRQYNRVVALKAQDQHPPAGQKTLLAAQSAGK